MVQESTQGYVAGFPDTLNFRELGGLVSADGRAVRHGLLYRGSTLDKLSEEERKTLDGLGLRFMLDLRARGEAAEKDDYVPRGATYCRRGGMMDAEGREVDFSPAGIAHIAKFIEAAPEAFMRNLYVSMVFDNPAVHLLVEQFAQLNAPLYFHCSAGKDRTGVCAAILLVLLGVTDEQILDNFLLTNEYRAAIINMAPEELPEWVSERDRENWAKMNGVNKADLEAALAAIDERYESGEAYALGEFGLGEADLARIRDFYLEQIA